MPGPAGNFKLLKNNFTSGELSPRMGARTDLTKYASGVATLENWLIFPQGGIYRRPGTLFVTPAKFNATEAHLWPFTFSTVQAYVIETGNLYLRFYKNGGRIESPPGTPVEVVTPYLVADIPSIKFCQSADTFYIVHQNYKPAKLTRTSDTAWTYTKLAGYGPNQQGLVDGPYRDENIVLGAKVAASATANPAGTAITGAANNGSGLIRITAVANGLVTGNQVKVKQVLGTTEANAYWVVTSIDADHVDLQGSVFTNTYVSGGNIVLLPTLTASGTNNDGTAYAPFQTSGSYGDLAGHKMALWRVKAVSVYGYCIIAFVQSSTVCSIDIFTAFDGTGATTLFREGAWSDYRGYPGAITINEQRLVFAGNPSEPQRVWASTSNSYENFVPGTTDSNAWTYQIGSTVVDVVRWLSPVSRGLIVGTGGSEFLMRGALGGAAGSITPTSVDVHPHTVYGSKSVQPVRLAALTYFVQRAGQKIREMQYSFASDTFVAPDRTVLSEHITGTTGIHTMAYQQEPAAVLWCTREDGQIAAATVFPEQEVFGWARVVTGGYAGEAQETYDHHTVIASPDGLSDQVWCTTHRIVNGADSRMVEYFSPTVNTDAASMLDNTVTTATVTPSAFTGNGVTFTASAGVFSAGNVGSYIMVLPVGTTAPAFGAGGKGRAIITAFTDTMHVTANIIDDFPNPIVPVPAGNWGIGVLSFSGLSYLALRTVHLVGDGALYGPNPVVTAGGMVTVPAGGAPIVKAEIGIPYTATVTTLRPEYGQFGTSAQLDKKRYGWVRIRALNTIGMQFVIGSNVYDFPTRSASDPLGTAPPSITGDFDIRNATGWDYVAQMTITQTNPFPSVILALMGRLELGGEGD